MPLRPRDDQPLGDGQGQPAGNHGGDGLGDDDWFPPGPNYLAQFRKPMTEAEMDEMARALERAIVEVFGEPDDEP
jgi:hypothetical protein